ncbi:MAG: flippase [Chloroflexaceae bacterium]|nr:flippase [Chloroflexaceae bacterium]
MTLLATTLARLRAAWQHAGLRRAGSSAGWMLAERLVRLAGGAFVGIWLARYLGPAAFGVYNFAIALSVIVTSLTTLGLDGILVRELVRDPAGEGRLLGSAALLRVTGGLGASLTIVALAASLRPDDPTVVALTAIIGVAGVLQASTVVDLWFRARLAARDAALARALAYLAAVLLRVGLILAGAPLIAFAWAFVAEALLGAAAVLLAYGRQGGNPLGWRPSLAAARALLADSWPLIFSGLLVNLYLRVDQVMLARLRGDVELGLYSGAVRIAEVFPILPNTIVAALLPAVVAARAAGPARYAQRLQQLYGLVAALGYAFALPVTLLAGPLTVVLLGSAYASAAPALVVLTWAGLFGALGVARSSFLTAENYTRLHLATVALGCVANLGLNWWLIPPLGGLGAAIASLISYWLAAHGSCFLFPALRPTGMAMTRALLWPRFW